MPGESSIAWGGDNDEGPTLRVTVRDGERQQEIEIDPVDRSAGHFRLRLDEETTRDVRVLARRSDWLTVEIDGQIHDLVVFETEEGYVVEESTGFSTLQVIDQRRSAAGFGAYEPEGVVSLRAQMPGRVIRVLKLAGESVESGEGLIIIESMKMQNQLKSPKSGKIRKCEVKDGQNVNAGDLLFEIE